MILAHKTWIVTVFPPKKNLVPRFESRKELEDWIGSKKVWRVSTKGKSQSAKLLLLLCNESIGFKTSQSSFFLYQFPSIVLALASDSLKRRVSSESRNDQTTRLVDHLKLLEQKIKDTKALPKVAKHD